MAGRVRAVLRGPLARIVDGPVSKKMLGKVGTCLVKALAKESKVYFAKRGWSERDPMGGPSISKSFKWQIRGQSTLEIISSYYGMSELAKGDIPARKMTWLTQSNKERHPEKFKLTPLEKRLKMKRGGSSKRGTRLPLIVPIRTKSGDIEFRMAPLTTADAWIHPGIARFTFFETAIRKWRLRCADVIAESMAEALKEP